MNQYFCKVQGTVLISCDLLLHIYVIAIKNGCVLCFCAGKLEMHASPVLRCVL